ncbi:MAG: 3-keto-5-aminohexanoate cleavage enzyme [Actinomycetota bacterium]|jgi:3-keto-5-aminohexanoate cleavage enzyme|nr:3-keto-5-aminohexanoate cleavage enzyme [Actinomycetota bacterium]
MITVAAIGAELTRDDQPNLPITPEEIAADAVACRAAGASIYHLHVRDSSGRPTMDVETFRSARDAINDATDLIVQFTSGGAVSDTEEARAAPLELQPEMATLTPGSVNFGDEVFWNPKDLVHRFYERMRSLSIVPEFEIFDSGMVAGAERLHRDSPDHHLHYDFVLGVPGGMPAWPDAIGFLSSKLPEHATWSATGIGRNHLPVTRDALMQGGHVRTGFEDVLFYERGRVAASNAELIGRVAAMAREAGREIATPGQARLLLELA